MPPRTRRRKQQPLSYEIGRQLDTRSIGVSGLDCGTCSESGRHYWILEGDRGQKTSPQQHLQPQISRISASWQLLISIQWQ